MKKVIGILLVLVLMFSIAGCGKDIKEEVTTETTEGSSEVTEETEATAADATGAKITFLNTKGEIQAQLENLALTFQAESGIELEIIPAGSGTSPFEKMTSLYASGNAPTLAMMDIGDLPAFADKMEDLSNEKWISDAMPGSLEIAQLDGKQLAFPFAVEGFGLIYNKAAIESATGETFDPASIATKSDLEALFVKIEAGGIAPIIISPLDWSLAAHYLSIPFAAEGKDLTGINAIMDGLKAGTYDFASSEAFTNSLDTLDMLLEYNLDKADPLSGTYETGATAVAVGDAAFWFMGNWAWPQINELASTEEFGFIPVPVDVDGAVNSISAGPTKYVAIDKDQSTPEQIAAAKTFLNWLIYEENGQNGLVKECSIIPAFLNIEIAPDDALAQSILAYMAEGKTIPMVLSFPSDHWAEVGADMQKYISGYSTRDELNADMADYWKNAK